MASLLLIATNPLSAKTGKVYVFPTLHRLHQQNTNYTYDSLKAAITRIRPDIIAIEIRPEDISADSNYLRNNYPYEMWMMRYWFPSVQIAGIDWLGEDIAGKVIPPDYWKNRSFIKKLERELDDDSLYQASLKICDTSFVRRMDLLKGATMQGLMKSKYDFFTKQFYSCHAEKLKGSRYEYVPYFYEKRNYKLSQNCITLIRSNADKTIIILTGADHWGYIRDFLKKAGIPVN